MPKPPQPRLSADDVDVVRRWIAAGAPAFPDDTVGKDPNPRDQIGRADVKIVGVDYVLDAILKHVESRRVDDRKFYRYFSISHLTKPEQEVNRARAGQGPEQPVPGAGTGAA